MRVRLRFKNSHKKRAKVAPKLRREPDVVTPEEMAGTLATLLHPAAVILFAIAGWRLGQDLGIAGEFFLTDGPFSHWQPWLGAAAAVVSAALWLNRRSRPARVRLDDDEAATS
ncbi:MAG: hypothetical protein HY858_05155 [Candidatus Solibacter usitatus]|nr:hypothetical protein [Candidatus Solibacter usitatus]